MGFKTCTKCGETKPATLEHFYKHKNGLTTLCKTCVSTQGKTYREANRDREISRKKVYRQANRDKELEKRKLRYLVNRPHLLVQRKIYYESNRNAEIERSKRYAKDNREEVATRRRRYGARRRSTDPVYRVVEALRKRVREAVKGHCKSARTLQLLGCSIERLREHISKQFKPGMSWENYGKWHIDHIRPCASFNLAGQVQQRQCFHYTNLQPLWALENILKGAQWEVVHHASDTRHLLR